MIGKVRIKRAIKRTAGLSAALMATCASRRPQPQACILVYHRVGDIDFVDPRIDDWNVSPATFERQIAALTDFAELVPLASLSERLTQPARKPLVAITFDDGYATVCSRALPILQRFRTPATAFIVTSVIGRREPVPFDTWSTHHWKSTPPELWQAMSWQQLEACVASGIITLGSHSHWHLHGGKCSEDELLEETERSRAILASKFGVEHARCYAYPFGCTRLGQAPPAYVAAVRRAGYSLAVTTDLGLMRADSAPLMLPRIEAHELDTPAVLRAKVLGVLGLYPLLDHLRGRAA